MKDKDQPGAARTSVLATESDLRDRIRRKSRLKGRQPTEEALQAVGALLGTEPTRRDLLIEYLHLLNDRFGGLHDAHLVALARLTNLPMAEIHEVASFYHHFELLPDGARPPTLTVRVCDGLSCTMAGAADLLERLPALLGDASIRVIAAPCVGRCEQAPVAIVHQHPVPAATAESVRDCVAAGRRAHPRAAADGDFEPASLAGKPVGDGSRVQAVAPAYVGLKAYRDRGGYRLAARIAAAVATATASASASANGATDKTAATDRTDAGGSDDDKTGVEAVLRELENSGLRGLGGAGFPAGRKWRIVREQPGPRVMAVNIDEGEPGTFKDRTYLERDPHRFLEGMLIAATVVGIDACYLYLRDEYHGCRELLQHELALLRADPPFALPKIELRRGAGAYICGEESAMIESIEGKRGEPRMRPPYIAQVGLFGRPTLEHNFETLYWVRDILERGAAWFAGFGRHGRRGLRSFSVSGRVREPGVKLAPAGITLQELVDEYCGGMQPGHRLYGYLPGGASGGILPARLNQVPLDFDTLQQHGCFIGSAAVIVLGDRDRARDAASNMMSFFAHESCGQCTPCRVGTAKAVPLLQARQWDAATLRDLNQVMADASICGLGQAAPNPVRCVLDYFPDEVS